MSDIVRFLHERITEDEEIATAAAEVGTARGYIIDQGGDGNGLTYDDSGILLVDPARVLAECTAKRKIIEAHDSGGAWCDHCSGGGVNDGGCPTILAILSIYADHPDFDPAWATT